MLYAGFFVLLALFVTLLVLAYRLLRRRRTALRIVLAMMSLIVALCLLVPLWYFGILSYLLLTGSSFGP